MDCADFGLGFRAHTAINNVCFNQASRGLLLQRAAWLNAFDETNEI